MRASRIRCGWWRPGDGSAAAQGGRDCPEYGNHTMDVHQLSRYPAGEHSAGDRTAEEGGRARPGAGCRPAVAHALTRRMAWAACLSSRWPAQRAQLALAGPCSGSTHPSGSP